MGIKCNEETRRLPLTQTQTWTEVRRCSAMFQVHWRRDSKTGTKEAVLVLEGGSDATAGRGVGDGAVIGRPLSYMVTGRKTHKHCASVLCLSSDQLQ